MDMVNEFITWLTKELNDRGWTNSELARRSELVPSTVSMVISGKTNPGLEFCLGVARAFGLPPEAVLRKAGLLPPLPAAVEGEQEVIGILRTLTAGQRNIILSMLRALAPQVYSLASDLRATRYAVAENRDQYTTGLEAELLEQFRRLPHRWQEIILADVESMAHRNSLRIIEEEDDG